MLTTVYHHTIDGPISFTSSGTYNMGDRMRSLQGDINMNYAL